MKKLTNRLLWTTAVISLGLALSTGAPRAAEPPPAAPSAPAAKMPPAAKAPPVAKAPPATNDAKEVTLKGTLGCGKCSFREAKACENVLKVKTGSKEDTYVLADNAVSQANHDKVCGPTSPATVTGTVSKGDKKSRGKKILTASAIKFE